VWHCVSGVDGRVWKTRHGESIGSHIQVEFLPAKVANGTTLKAPPELVDGRCPAPTEIAICASHDGVTFLKIIAVYTSWTPNEEKTIRFRNSTAYEFYRLVFLNCPSDVLSLANVNFLSRKTRPIPEWFVRGMTSNTSDEFILSASSEQNSLHAVWRVFSIQRPRRWATEGGKAGNSWIQVVCRSPLAANAVQFQAREDVPKETPTDWYLMASSNGKDFRELLHINLFDVGDPTPEERIYAFDNEQPYKYYRFVFKANAGSPYMGLATLNLGRVPSDSIDLFA
jgi:hypothetical protein